MLEFCTYVENKAPECFPPALEVRIQVFGMSGRGEHGEKLITPGMINAQEVDQFIDRIIRRLEVVRNEAKSKLEENQ